MIELIKKTISYLKVQLKEIDENLSKLLVERAKTDPNVNILQSVPGVGVVTTSTLLAELPELGELNMPEKISGVRGLAPDGAERTAEKIQDF